MGLRDKLVFNTNPSDAFPVGPVGLVHRQRDRQEAGEGADEDGPDPEKGRRQEEDLGGGDGRGHQG